MTYGRELVPLATLMEPFFAETEPLLSYRHQGEHYFEVQIFPGAPDREGEEGVMLYWHDGVTGEWAEHYSDLATAVARLAALIKCVETDEFFKDGPQGFVRWSDNFFTQTVRSAPQPNVGKD